LWLIDGWDEVIPSGVIESIQTNAIADIEYLIAGTRPEASLLIVHDGMLHVNGFSEQGREAYIKKYFKNAPEDEGKVRNLLSLSPFLDDACKIPLMLNLVCFASPQLEGANFTMSQIYDTVTSELIERASHTQDKVRSQNKGRAPKLSLAKSKKITKKLKKLGYQHMNNQKVKHQDLGELKKTLLRVGILHFSNMYVEWNHKTFAEYFAALYCCSKKKPPVPSKISDIFLVFYCSKDQSETSLQILFQNITSSSAEYFFIVSKFERPCLVYALCFLECPDFLQDKMIKFGKSGRKVQEIVQGACMLTMNFLATSQ
jgi:hypothetical protein